MAGAGHHSHPLAQGKVVGQRGYKKNHVLVGDADDQGRRTCSRCGEKKSENDVLHDPCEGNKVFPPADNTVR